MGLTTKGPKSYLAPDQGSFKLLARTNSNQKAGEITLWKNRLAAFPFPRPSFWVIFIVLTLSNFLLSYIPLSHGAQGWLFLSGILAPLFLWYCQDGSRQGLVLHRQEFLP